MHLAVLQFDTFLYLVDILLCHWFVEEHVVNLLLQELRMCEFRSEVAVIGEQQHTSGVAVETSYRIDALWTHVLNEVHNGLALLRIVTGGDIVLRLVEQNVNLLLWRNLFLVEDNNIGTQYLGAQFGNHLSVNRNLACQYVLVSLAAAAHSCICKELVQTDWLVRINVLLLIFNAFLQTIFCIRVISLSTWTIAIAALIVAALLT